MAKRVSRNHIGQIMCGRLLSYDCKKGYGFIRTSTNEDIFLSSHSLKERSLKRIHERKLCVGDYLQFTVGTYDGVRTIAEKVEFIEQMPWDFTVSLPNYPHFRVRSIAKFGRDSLASKDMLEAYPDLTPKDFDYVFVRTKSSKEFIFNNLNSPIIINGACDTTTLYDYLYSTLVDYKNADAA